MNPYCTNSDQKVIPYFIAGDTFKVPFQLYDIKTGKGFEITQEMEIAVKIVDIQGRLIAEPEVTVYPNQQTDKGFVLLSVAPNVSATWRSGFALFDIKVMISGQIKHSSKYKFEVDEAIS